ncbi:MAG: response regulator transcription factor [Magnetospirillum sp.]|nr:response regulator transcription factor [Magnetospirillum sp.]
MKQNQVLVVEDEPVTRTRLVGHLRADGFIVGEAGNVAEARDLFARMSFDVVVLDVNLPDGSGFTLTREMRARSQVGIILVTQRHEETDRIVGLELGSDDYLVKPVNPRELSVRVRNLVRRVHVAMAAEHSAGEGMSFAGFQLDGAARQLRAPGGSLIDLTRGEFEILAVLAKHVGRPLTRQQIVDLTLGQSPEPMSPRSVDVLVARLRRKIEASAKEPRILQTVHGIGYRIVVG